MKASWPDSNVLPAACKFGNEFLSEVRIERDALGSTKRGQVVRIKVILVVL